jgi:dCMP deaminase
MRSVPTPGIRDRRPGYVHVVTPERAKQVERDRYYMSIAEAVEAGADCVGTKVGAVVVLKNRIVSTGYNGTPEGFPNCQEGGCVRCHDSTLHKAGLAAEMSDPTHTSGAALDRCICVHAEQNAFLTAARFGIELDGATLYTTYSPCFGCLKEAVQAGIQRVVYRTWYDAKYNEALEKQYKQLYKHLSDDEPTRFEKVGGGRPPLEEEGQPDPHVDQSDSAVTLEAPPASPDAG